MKRIEALIRPSRIGKVCTALEEVSGRRPVISHIEEHGGRDGIRYLSHGRTYKVDLMTKTRVEMTVKDTEAEEIVKAIRSAAFTGDTGDGMIFVHAMDGAVQISAGDGGECGQPG